MDDDEEKRVYRAMSDDFDRMMQRAINEPPGPAMSVDDFKVWLDTLKPNPFNDLARFGSIGWDFDGVLYDHPLAVEFQDYIIRNERKQKHYIVTFRSGGLYRSLWSDLKRSGSQLRPDHFRAVLGVPHLLWQSYQRPHQGIHPYIMWKGKMCHRYGIDVLIDDATIEVFSGCGEYQIEYLHPDMLF